MTTDHSPRTWPLQRAWAYGSARRWVWAGSLLLMLMTLAAAGVSLQRARGHSAALERQLSQAGADVQPLLAPAPAAEKDFTPSLGSPLNAAQVVQELQRACTAAGVLLVGVQAQERAATLEQLGRLELAVTLRGAYPGTKQALKQVVERYPQVTVQRLRMRRAQSPTEVDTSVTLSVWSAPLADSLAAKEH